MRSKQSGLFARRGESFFGTAQKVPRESFWIQKFMDEIFVRVTWLETRGAFTKCHAVYCSA